MNIHIKLFILTLFLLILMALSSGCADMDAQQRYYGAGTSYSSGSRTYTPQRVVVSPTPSNRYQASSVPATRSYSQRLNQITKRAAEVSKATAQQTKEIQRRALQRSATESRQVAQSASLPVNTSDKIVYVQPNTYSPSNHVEQPTTTYHTVTKQKIPSYSDIVKRIATEEHSAGESITCTLDDMSWLFWVIGSVVVFGIVFYFCHRGRQPRNANNDDPWVIDPARR